MSEEKLKLKIGLLNSKLREADDELMILEDKYIKERDKNDFLYKQIADAESKNRNYEKELSSYEDEIVKMKNDIILKDIAIKTHEKKINAMNNELISLTDMNETLKKSLGDLEKYVKEKENYIEDNVNDDKNTTQKELDYERDRIIKLHHDINIYKTECNRLTNQITELEKANIELENKLIFMSQTYMKNIKPVPVQVSLENELKIKKYEEEILTLKSQNKGLNAENLKLIDENYTLRYDNKKCFCSIQ